MVFDAFWMDSLKGTTRRKRGRCIRRHVEGNKQVPSNCQEFLRVDEKKSELFHVISDRIVDEEFPGLVIVTRDDEVLSFAACDLEGLMSCTHEEADTRMFVHASYEAEHGMNKILLRTVDTYVVVIRISMAQHIGCDCLWLAFGTGTTFRSYLYYSPKERLPSGHTLPWRAWRTANRVRSGQAATPAAKHIWGYRDSKCGLTTQETRRLRGIR